ncbi:MAG: MurR/RpiR family transcriptional regulator, partial [Gemmobacter sp.]|nr:MurR/RpiR family transcriptional regulator [Gemmobacter sp.]
GRQPCRLSPGGRDDRRDGGVARIDPLSYCVQGRTRLVRTATCTALRHGPERVWKRIPVAATKKADFHLRLAARQAGSEGSLRSFVSRVRATLPDLHPAERRLGELLSDFPGEMASYSASELATLAGVSNATVTRFIRRLGYGSFDEARRHAREDRSTGSRLYLDHAGEVAPSGSVAHLIERDLVNVQDVLADIAGQDIDALALALLEARKVWVMGFRAGFPFALYLQWQLTQVIENIVALPGGGQTMGEHLASLDQRDIVILFGLRRRVAQTGALIAAIRQAEVRLAYVTDEGAPRQDGAEWHFRCNTESGGPLFSHVAVMALCNVLANRTIAQAGREGRVRLQQIEKLNDSLSEL